MLGWAGGECEMTAFYWFLVITVAFAVYSGASFWVPLGLLFASVVAGVVLARLVAGRRG